VIAKILNQKGKEVINMAGKKENCGCGCIGQKQTTPKAPKNRKKPKKSK
jgi:hypothetical protein